MAIGFRDGWGVHSVHGVRVPGWIVESPGEITPEKIDSEGNAEIRRVMVEKFGVNRYVSSPGTETIGSDDWGVLLRRNMGADDEPIVVVKVVNSSPEPDGRFKDYFLRVPPNIETPRQAVAWLNWKDSAEEYAPVMQT
jgi:hypothetical protein